MKRDRLFEEGVPLLPGKYAGPQEFIDRDDQVQRAVRHYLYAWLFSILIGPVIFTAYLLGNSGAMTLVATNIADQLVCVAPATPGLFSFCIAKADELLWKTSLDHYFTFANQFAIYILLPAMVVFAVVSFRTKHVYRGLCLSLSALAAIAGFAFGYYLFIMHFDVYRQFRNLVTYVNIDPQFDVGGAYMDAGEVYFKEGSRVDTKRAIAVRSKDIFCAAPIVREGSAQTQAEEEEGLQPPPPSGTVDWWVIGKNCCLPSGEQFTCGLSGLGPSVYPRAGLRLLPEYERHLYRLAVDEWSSQYNTPATHPLFFSWDVDPIATVNAHTVTGWMDIWKGAEMFAVLNILVTTFAITIANMVQETEPQEHFDDLEDAPIDEDGNAVNKDDSFDDDGDDAFSDD
jgi:hypothetical protein